MSFRILQAKHTKYNILIIFNIKILIFYFLTPFKWFRCYNSIFFWIKKILTSLSNFYFFYIKNLKFIYYFIIKINKEYHEKFTRINKKNYEIIFFLNLFEF